MVEDGYDSADVLMVSTSELDEKWIMDSGCTFHMTTNKDCMRLFEKSEEDKSSSVISKDVRLWELGQCRSRCLMVLKGCYNKSGIFHLLKEI